MDLENLTVKDRRRDAVYGAQNFTMVNAGSAPQFQSTNLYTESANGSSYNSGPRAGRLDLGSHSRNVRTGMPGLFNYGRLNGFAASSAPVDGRVHTQHAEDTITQPVIVTSQPQTLNPLRSLTEASSAPNGASIETGNNVNKLDLRSSGQSSSRRNPSVLRSSEDLHIPQEERPWHEDKWPGFGGHRQVSADSTDSGQCVRGPASHSGPRSHAPTVSQGDTVVMGNLPTMVHPQIQPSLLLDESGLADVGQSQDIDLEFLPFVRTERPITPLQHSEFKLSNANPTILPKFDIYCNEVEPHNSSYPHNIVGHSLFQPFGVHRTPENSYTSPKRMENVLRSSRKNLKRKRDGSGLPPPAYVYVRTNNPKFDIFANGFLLYPELCFALATQMPLRDLISLYAISKDFHTIIDSRFTTVCISQALRKAPESAKIFRFRFYAQYCRYDPVARIPHPNPIKAEMSIPRMIPSFRWVAFILHREKVVHELITMFAERGCPLPAHCSLALKKMWLIMDIPENARRIGLMHNPRFITDIDLYFMMCVIVKLDMIANDPLAAEKRDGLRRLLFSQEHGLDVMNKVLKREMWRKKSDYLAAYIRNNTNLEPFNDDNLNLLEVDSIFGVPHDQVGLGKFEFWGKKGINDPVTGIRRPYLIRPDQLVQREAIRRGINFSGHYLRCILYGYVDPDTLENCPPREYGRRIAEWKDEDYDILDSVGGLRALSVEDGGDPLLDLGDTRRGSPYTIKKEPVSEQERAMRESREAFTQRMYELSKMERDAEKTRKI